MTYKASNFQKSSLTLWGSDGYQFWVKLQEISQKNVCGFYIYQLNVLV